MSYLHVDAINQQFPAEKLPPPQLLILTKFAEKLPYGGFSKKIGRDTLMKITHISDHKTLRRHLLDLDKKGILLCPQLYERMSDGDEPRIFTLKYPEPFDVAVINERRNRFYGGMPFAPKFSDSDEESVVKVGDQLESVSSSEPRNSEPKGKLTVDEGILTAPKGNLTVPAVKIPPYNKGINQYNNNVDVAVDGEVEKFLEAAAKATNSAKGSFVGLVKNVAEARIGLDAVRYFQDSIVPSGKAIRSPIGFLRDLIGKAIAAGGVSAMTGEIAAPKVKTDAEKLQEAIIVVFKRYLTQAPFEGLLSKEEKNVFCRSCFEKFRRPDGEQYLECFFKDFLYVCRGYEFESSERLLTELNAFLQNFLAEHP